MAHRICKLCACLHMCMWYMCIGLYRWRTDKFSSSFIHLLKLLDLLRVSQSRALKILVQDSENLGLTKLPPSLKYREKRVFGKLHNLSKQSGNEQEICDKSGKANQKLVSRQLCSRKIWLCLNPMICCYCNTSLEEAL